MRLVLVLIDKRAEIAAPYRVGGFTYAVYRCCDGHIYIDLDTARSVLWQ